MLYCVSNSFRIKYLSLEFVRILLLHIEKTPFPFKILPYQRGGGEKRREKKKKKRETFTTWLFLPNRQTQLCWRSWSNSFLLSFIRALGLKKPEWLLPANLFSDAFWNTVLRLLFCGSPHPCLWKVHFGHLQCTKLLISIIVRFCLLTWRSITRFGGFFSTMWSSGYFLNTFSK